jgi:hypothetical protein
MALTVPRGNYCLFAMADLAVIRSNDFSFQLVGR